MNPTNHAQRIAEMTAGMAVRKQHSEDLSDYQPHTLTPADMRALSRELWLFRRASRNAAPDDLLNSACRVVYLIENATGIYH